MKEKVNKLLQYSFPLKSREQYLVCIMNLLGNENDILQTYHHEKLNRIFEEITHPETLLKLRLDEDSKNFLKKLIDIYKNDIDNSHKLDEFVIPPVNFTPEETGVLLEGDNVFAGLAIFGTGIFSRIIGFTLYKLFLRKNKLYDFVKKKPLLLRLYGVFSFELISTIVSMPLLHSIFTFNKVYFPWVSLFSYFFRITERQFAYAEERARFKKYKEDLKLVFVERKKPSLAKKLKEQNEENSYKRITNKDDSDCEWHRKHTRDLTNNPVTKEEFDLMNQMTKKENDRMNQKKDESQKELKEKVQEALQKIESVEFCGRQFKNFVPFKEVKCIVRYLVNNTDAQEAPDFDTYGKLLKKEFKVRVNEFDDEGNLSYEATREDKENKAKFDQFKEKWFPSDVGKETTLSKQFDQAVKFCLDFVKKESGMIKEKVKKEEDKKK